MATNLGTLFARIGVDTRGLKKGEKDLRGFTGKAKKEISGLRKAVNTLGVAFAGIISLRTGIRILQTADGFQQLTNRVTSATLATGNFTKVMQNLKNISLETGSALKTNVSLFQAINRGAGEVGASIDDVLKFTKAVNQLGIIGGSSAEELSFGLRQLSQGLSAGILRAEEFNSILENTPEIGNRIAKGMGLTVGALRNAVLAGEVLSEDVFESLLKQTEQINKEFGNIPITLNRATQVLKTSFQIAAGEAGALRPILDSITQQFLMWSDILLAPRASLEALGQSAIEIFKRATVNLREGFAIVIARIRINFLQMFEEIAERFNALPFVPDIDISNIQTKLRELDKSILEARGRRSQGIADSFNREIEQASAFEERKKEIIKGAQDTQLEEQSTFLAALAKNTADASATQQTLAMQQGNNLVILFQKNQRAKDAIKKAELAASINNSRALFSQAAQSSKEFFALNKALVLGNILVKTPQAIADGFAFGNSFGGPPVGVVFGALAGAAMGVQFAAASATSFTGKQTGGSVFPGSISRVNEGNKPELLSVGGNDFLMMGAKGGEITPNNKLTGPSMPSSGVIVNVFNIPGQEATVTESQGPNGETQLDIFIQQADQAIASGISGGTNQTARALEDTFGLNRGSRAKF